MDYNKCYYNRNRNKVLYIIYQHVQKNAQFLRLSDHAGFCELTQILFKIMRIDNYLKWTKYRHSYDSIVLKYLSAVMHKLDI